MHFIRSYNEDDWFAENFAISSIGVKKAAIHYQNEEEFPMIYDYTVTTGKGEKLNLADYQGKVIMVVNTATGCGFTPQYAPIEQMYKDYHD